MRRAHYALLVALREDGPASQAALGRRLAADRSDMHRTVGELESRGLIAREPDPDDRRRNLVTLDGARHPAVEDVDVRVDAAQAELLAPLSAGERDVLVRLLGRVLARALAIRSPARVTPASRSAHKSERPAEAGRPGGGEILLCDGSVSVGSMREVRVLLASGRRSSSRREAICLMHAHLRVMSITGACVSTFPDTVQRVRLDTLLAERGLFSSRARAAASVLAGEVRLGPGRERAAKPGQMVATDVDVAVDDRPRYVSRGGTKLANALDALGLDVAGRRALDAGASTGGFTDVLLQRGARARRRGRRRLRRARLGAAQRRPRDRPRAHERPRAEPVRPALRARSARRRPLLHLAAQGAARAAGLHGAAVRRARDGQAAVRGGQGARRGRRRGPRAGRPALGARRRRRPPRRSSGASVLAFASSGLPGPKGNRETFAWLAEGGREGAVGDVEAAAAEVEPS